MTRDNFIRIGGVGRDTRDLPPPTGTTVFDLTRWQRTWNRLKRAFGR